MELHVQQGKRYGPMLQMDLDFENGSMAYTTLGISWFQEQMSSAVDRKSGNSDFMSV